MRAGERFVFDLVLNPLKTMGTAVLAMVPDLVFPVILFFDGAAMGGSSNTTHLPIQGQHSCAVSTIANGPQSVSRRPRRSASSPGLSRWGVFTFSDLDQAEQEHEEHEVDLRRLINFPIRDGELFADPA